METKIVLSDFDTTLADSVGGIAAGAWRTADDLREIPAPLGLMET